MSQLARRALARLTYANVVATLALFVALGTGGAYAATQLSKNSVGGKQLRKNAVTGSKVKNGSLGVGEFSKKARRRLAGAAGPPGATGPTGPAGPAGAAAASEFAVVADIGGLTAGTAVGIDRSSGNVYSVRFNRNVTRCAYYATPSSVPVSGTPGAEAPPAGTITTSDDGANTVIVKTFNGGAPQPFAFRLSLVC